jgi:phosphate-selective porin OprO/OprP
VNFPFRCCALPLLLLVWQGPTGPACAQETESQALARRLTQLEAEVARLRQITPVSGELPPTPPEFEYLDDPYATGESAGRIPLPPSPAPPLESLWTQPPAPATTGAAPAVNLPPQPKYPIVIVNGFFQADNLYFGQDPQSHALNGNLQDGADFRRFRLSARGSVIENVNYFGQLDFGLGRPVFTDVWGEVTKVPFLGNVRFGQWKQPYSLEVVTTVRYQTFLERSVLFQSFDPFRRIGIGFYDHNQQETMTWAMSGFRQGQDLFGNDIGDAGGNGSAGRITFLPFYEKDGDDLHYLHLGSGYYIGDPQSNELRIATIPEAFVGAVGSYPGSPIGTSRIAVPNIINGTPPFVNTGPIPIHFFSNVGTEFLYVNGPVSIQSEAQLSTLAQRNGGPQLNFWGMYAFASVLLTGESRPYDRKFAVLDRIVPRSPFLTDYGCGTGTGAWELALRWSYIDLNDANINGGRLSDVTAGLNWYLNGYTKVQFNYIRAYQSGFPLPNAATDIYGLRAQVDW